MRQTKGNSHHCYGHDRLKTPFHTQFLSMRGASRRVRILYRIRRASPIGLHDATAPSAFRNPSLGQFAIRALAIH
jgi:hypothetical protein